MAFDNTDAKAVWAARLGTTPKGVNCNFSSPEFNKPYGVWKLFISDVLMQFQQDWPKDKKVQLLIYWLETAKFRSTELDRAPLEGSTILQNCISTCRMSMESYWLAELKRAVFSRTGHKTKCYDARSSLSTVFKHELLEGLTILLQYSAITCTPLESYQLSGLKYAISAG